MKRSISELAIFGGSALFDQPLAVGRPNIPDIDSVVADIRGVLQSGILTNRGPFVNQFENEVRRIAGADHCIATCNATAALELTMRALDLDGEVIVPSFTFVATAHAVSWLGLTPVFVDVNSATHTIDPDIVEAAISPATSAICGVHLWGNACDVDALQVIADRHNLAVIYDAAHAFSVSRNGTPIGSFGAAEIFSFHATKFINSFEGGAVVTNDSVLAQTIREMSNFGFSANHQVMRFGTNAKMSEASAVMGLNSLECLDQIREVNLRNWRRYNKLLARCPGLNVTAPLEPKESNCQYVVCEIDEHESNISRDRLMSILEAEGVLAKRYFSPGCHQELPYCERHLRSKDTLPVTEKLAQTVLVLPTGMNIAIDDIDRICALIRYIIESAADIQSEMERSIKSY